MIISEFAICSTNNRNYRRLKSLGYEFNIGDQVKVNVRHLSKSSRSLVFVQCDICGFNKSMKYSMYLKNIKKYGFYTCSGKCSSIKYKKTCLEKFGTETPLQNDEIKGKLKKYFLMKYGVNHPSMINEFEIKKQQTNLEKYGVRHLFEGIDRKYHSDFYLPNFNLICEIKSEYIYNKEVKINEIKKESSIKSGYNFIFIIDKDYSNFIKIIENNVNSAF